MFVVVRPSVRPVMDLFLLLLLLLLFLVWASLPPSSPMLPVSPPSAPHLGHHAIGNAFEHRHLIKNQEHDFPRLVREN